MSRTRSAPLFLAAAAALAAAGAALPGHVLPVPAARADDGPVSDLPPKEAYEAFRTKSLPEVAAKLADAAAFAWRNKLKRTALDLYRQAMELDPENRDARDRLGFDRRNDAWVASEYKQKKLEDVEDESERKRGDFEKKLDEVNRSVSVVFAELGNKAESADALEDANAWWKRALERDDQNAVANEKMGNVKVDGKWFTRRSLDHKEFMKAYSAALDKAKKLQVAVTETNESTGVGEAAKIRLNIYRTKNFRIESSLPSASIRETLPWLERARLFFLTLYDIPERLLDYENNPSTAVIVTSKEQYDKVVDTAPMIPEERRSFLKRFSGCDLGDRSKLTTAPDAENAQRFIVHSQTHVMVRDVFGAPGDWLREALANSVAAAVKDADLTVCFSGEGSTGGIHLDRVTLDQAPTILRNQVAAKKDTPIGGIVKLPNDGMNTGEIAKAWSVLMFLLEKDRTLLRDYVSRAGQGAGGENSKDDRVLKMFFSDYPSWTALDESWREWALDVYKE